MKNIKAIIAYDGTNYNGWQRQMNNSSIGVQNHVEKALTKVLGVKIEVNGAGRTDSGVHATGQVINFSTDTTLPIDRLALLVSRELPSDIEMISAFQVASDFHARYSAKGKTYSYIIRTGAGNVFNRNIGWNYSYDLDIDLMKEAASLFCGEHNFSAFQGVSTVVRNPVRNIDSFSVEKIEEKVQFPWQGAEDIYLIKVSGSGFLYKQVRLMVGAIVACGNNRLSLMDIEKALHGGMKVIAPPAPAKGLILSEVRF